MPGITLSQQIRSLRRAFLNAHGDPRGDDLFPVVHRFFHLAERKDFMSRGRPVHHATPLEAALRPALMRLLPQFRGEPRYALYAVDDKLIHGAVLADERVLLTFWFPDLAAGMLATVGPDGIGEVVRMRLMMTPQAASA